ncbi:MAG: alpha-L-fucosidase [Paludibacter sp.]|nr:alpha-L-fucosidase [Paludibacter sp.]
MKNHTLNFVVVLLLSANVFMLSAQESTEGKFKATDESLKQYQYPAWFRDAKFGIWAHWGPQAVPRQGDWYARKLYMQTGSNWETETYNSHLKTYGHPSVSGYKDIIPLWKAEKWNPEELMKLYKRVGAKYFVSMGTHHDNFFLWNSKIHRWNSINMGPKKDVVGLWQKAAQHEGLRFGVSEHLAASYTWFQTAHGSDKTGDKAGVPYDGNDPQYEDLYHAKAEPGDNGWLTINPVWQKEWFNCIEELIDRYHPDFLYSDSKLPFENTGRSMIAHYYNQDMKKNNGKLEAVYTCKEPSNGRFAQDVERGVLDSISEFPWQTDTSIGDWYYRTGQKYKTSDEVIQMLVDIVSKNGNLLLNVVQTPEGDLEPDVLNILEKIADWTKVNGEAIYGTRPWKVYGEGPSTNKNQEKGQFGGVKDIRDYQPTDLRFTTKDGVLYIFCMNAPTEGIQVKSLGKLSAYSKKAIASISMLGSKSKIQWKQGEGELSITKPADLPSSKVITFAVTFKK